jgi:hypothetical protein
VTPLTVTEYGEVPPLTVTVTLPSVPPWQVTGEVVSEAVIAAGSPTRTPVAEAVQPLESVMLAGYVPVAKPVKVVLLVTPV